MTRLEYHGTVDEAGNVSLPKRLRKEVSSTFRGKKIKVTFERDRKRHSDPQRGYYFAVIISAFVDIFNNAGWEAQQGNKHHIDQVHRFLTNRFLDNGPEVITAHGEVVKMPPSIRYCSTLEMENYFDDVRKWAAEDFNYVIPLPNEQLEFFNT
jgi:hypothetical protein